MKHPVELFKNLLLSCPGVCRSADNSDVYWSWNWRLRFLPQNPRSTSATFVGQPRPSQRHVLFLPLPILSFLLQCLHRQETTID